MGVFTNMQNSIIAAFMFKFHFCHIVTDRYQDQNFASNITKFLSMAKNTTCFDINYIHYYDISEKYWFLQAFCSLKTKKVDTTKSSILAVGMVLDTSPGLPMNGM